MGEERTLRFEATLTDKYQSTVPAPIRKALHLGKRDKIAYVLEGDRVILQKATPAEEWTDPAVEAYLAFLGREMIANPQRLRPFAGDTIARAAELVDGVTVDLDAPLNDE